MTRGINARAARVLPEVIPPRTRKVIVTSTDSVSRLAAEKASVAKNLDTSVVNDRFEQVLRPKSLAGGMKRLGIALVAAPDPITSVPGVALLASSYVMKSRESASLAHLAKETSRVLREMESLRI